MNNIFAYVNEKLGLEDEIYIAETVRTVPAEKSLVHYYDHNKQICLSSINHDRLVCVLGSGPMRFASKERPIEEQIESLVFFEREAFETIKKAREDQELDFWDDARRWMVVVPKENHHHNKHDWFDDAMYLRFARCNDFDAKAALKAMQNFNPHYFTLRCCVLEKQLLTKTLFIPPGLKTRQGLDCFYMRPSRYCPASTSLDAIIDNLVYIIQCMQDKESCSSRGVGFVANMAGWKLNNFSIPYCHEFMRVLMGERVPVQVRLFLIVDPPKWFNVVWEVMCQVLSKDFTERIHMIPHSELSRYLEDGYEDFLPDDMSHGNAKTKRIVSDFVTYRKYVERGRDKDDHNESDDIISSIMRDA